MNRFKDGMLRKLMAVFVLLACVLPVAAQERADTTYVFRFVPGRDMFYIPWQDNAGELARLEACIDTYREHILSGGIPLHVDGYCSSKESEAANLAVAKIRSNRVKSELIIRQGLTEACFITHNHASGGDYVTVRIIVPQSLLKPEIAAGEPVDVPAAGQSETPAEAADNRPTEPEQPAAPTAPKEAVAESENTGTVQTVRSSPTVAEEVRDTRLSVRANLLRWATLTPDLGVEWRMSDNWGILVNGSWTSWSWNDKARRYALWEVAPEVRYYMGKEKRGYVGALFKAGLFHYKFSATGKQGDLLGGGITGGYVLKLNRSLDLDFSLGVSYLHADYERYEVMDGVRVHRGDGVKNWWGPIHAGVTLRWNLF